MRTARRLWLVALFGYALVAGMAVATDAWREISYEKMHASLSSVRPLEGARYIRLKSTVGTSAPDMSVADVRMVIGAAAGDIEVPIAADGTLVFPMSDALLEENPPVRVNVPEGQLAVNVTIAAEVPPAERFPYSLVSDIADEYGRFVKQQGLLARMMAPDMNGVAVVFAAGEPAFATITGPAGETLPADESGRLVLPLRPEWDGAEVVLSRMPEAVEPVFED
jgi:hypothetical protein